MSVVYIGLGSNLGNRGKNCKNAIKLLIDNGIKVLRISSRIETSPWGVDDQPMFINMVVMAETDQEPEKLLLLLKKIEYQTGRTPGPRWGPRVIDLDILFYNDRVISTETLEVPHPLIQERAFVLKPLAEIAPDLIHPVLKKNMKELLEQLTQ